MNRWVVYGVAVLVALGLGGAAVRYWFPRVETKTVTVDREVVKYVRVAEESKRKVVHEYPDGHRVTVETTERTTDTRRDTDSTTRSEATSKPVDSQWRVGGMIGAELVPTLRPAYGVLVERRLLGPVHVGVWGISSGAVGLSLSVEF